MSAIRIFLSSVIRRHLPYLLVCWLPCASFAAEIPPIRQAIDRFLQSHAASLPGKASFVIGNINAQGLPDCAQLTVAMAEHAKPWGRSMVAVGCQGETPWRLYVPVQIHVAVDYLVSARPLRAGQIVSAEDVGTRPGDLFDLPATTLTDPAQAIGQVITSTLPTGRPLRRDLLRSPQVIQQGQTVKVISAGDGFQVSSEGQALNNAAAGQVVRVRLPSGQIASGTASSDGSVRVGY